MAEESKSFWKSFDFISKIFLGIIVALLPIIINWQAQLFNKQKQRTDLTTSLLQDLSQPQNAARKDIALLILDNSLRDSRDSSLVQQVAFTILTTPAVSDSSGKISFSDSKVANDIVKRNRILRDSLDSISNRLLRKTQQDTRSNADTSVVSKQSSVTPAQAQFLQAVLPGSRYVYIQYGDESIRNKAIAFQDTCKKRGWTAPGIELVNSKFDNSIRFFHLEDRPFANKVRAALDRYYKSIGKTDNIQLLDLSAKHLNAPKGQVEAWMK